MSLTTDVDSGMVKLNNVYQSYDQWFNKANSSI
jgi:hypothetical protein